MSDTFKITGALSTVRFAPGKQTCPVHMGESARKWLLQYLTSRPAENRIFLLADENTARHCLPLLIREIRTLENSVVIEIPAGEAYKDLEYCRQIWELLTDENAGKNSTLLCLGGGMICDLGGLSASLYKRGIPFIHLPTSLLAMTDAAIGGKNGVNAGYLKNTLGTIQFPRAVLIFPEFLSTLPRQEWTSGFAEVVKHALIGDSPLWQKIRKKGGLLPAEEMIRHSVKFKTRIVSEDPLEEGKRKILNFGHTLGHALESFQNSQNRKTSHGLAVAAGMICESRIALRKKLIREDEMTAIASFLHHAFPKVNFRREEIPQIVKYCYNDKKNKSENFASLSLISGIGNCVFNQPVPYAWLEDALNEYSVTAG